MTQEVVAGRDAGRNKYLVECGECGREIRGAEYLWCAECMQRNPDSRHTYWPPDARARIRQCLTCGTVRVMTCLIETKRFHPQTTAIRYRAEFLYYRPGSSQPDSVTSLCEPRRMESPRELCAHDVIEIPTTAERHLVGVTSFVPLISTAVLRSLFDETDLQYTASCSAYYWCARCGLLYGATPGGDLVVPHEGVVKIRAA